MRPLFQNEREEKENKNYNVKRNLEKYFLCGQAEQDWNKSNQESKLK